MDKLTMHTTDGVTRNVERIAALFPNCVTETTDEQGNMRHAVDYDKLRVELGEVVEGSEERYQFTWPGKRDAMRLANSPIAAALRPVREDSVNFDSTQNLYIEGDNLDVLKLLRETYLGKVKMIYIDPPYNTGNDFVYEDDFSQATGDYLANSGQYDEQGNRLVANTESNGRFHTDWLNMIYPRLKVARDLLTDDGVIFISIDDNEIENLKKVCNEIFGESNFLANIIWEKADSPRNDAKTFSSRHDFILLYAKDYKDGIILRNKIDEVAQHYDKTDEKGNRYYLKPLRYMGTADTREARPNLYFPIQSPNGENIYPVKADGSDGRWRWSKDKVESDYERLEFINGRNGWSVYIKIYADLEAGIPFETIWFNKDVGSNRTAIADIRNIFGEEKPFQTPKPVKLIEFIMGTIETKDSIILDFFSGSATTAHAVMQLNAEDGGSRKFIMVQLPEVTDEKSEARKAGYANICEIGKERIRRAGKKIKDEHPEAKDLDIGFRVLRLDSSNMEDVYYTPDKFDQSALTGLLDNVKSNRSEEDLLFQVMLELDVPLSATIKCVQIAGKKVFVVADGHLIATFDREVNETTVTEIAKQKPNFFVMRDASAANDNVLDNFEQIFRHYSPDTICKIL